MILEKINKPNDIKKLKPNEYNQLAFEIRKFLVENISKTGGHLASNLGVVELTMALHLVFNLPEDKLIWDVGHQSYTHKILTGRKQNFERLRKFGGMSGFPKRNESDYDAFDTGHSSTSISAGLGYVCARDVQKENYNVISVIGDGALTGGMAYEALNNASTVKGNFIIVLNDNKMSISKNVGGVPKMLNEVRSSSSYYDFKEGIAGTLNMLPLGDKIADSLKRTKDGIKKLVLPGQMFESMGLEYLGPVDGHDIDKLIKVFNAAKRIDKAVIVHVVTKKGYGYKPAEKNPSKFHGISPFNIKTGNVINKTNKKTYSDVFSDTICELAKENDKLVAITAAMPDGTGLSQFAKNYPKRFFDVGIAEGHAVTFCAGLAAGGLRPVFAVYSSFLQRAYDQILHDVCIQQLPVIFAIDRAGLVGSDGETHQGIFDLSFLRTIPNMVIYAPKNAWELGEALRFAVNEVQVPFAIRYPRGEALEDFEEFNDPIQYGRAEIMYWEKDIAIMSVGSMVAEADRVRKILKKRGYNASLINARFVKPMDKRMIYGCKHEHTLLVTIEENVCMGGFGEGVSRYVEETQSPLSVLNISLPDDYVEHGSVDILKSEAGIDAETIADRIISFYENI